MRPNSGSRRFRWRWLWLGIAVLVLIQVLVPLVTLNGARRRILQALQASLGRQVEAGDVHLHLLPWPSLELDQVRLADDPAFGAEAMVYASEATATVRFWPLVRGRMEIARVHLDGASINLVRNPAGAWNIATLLQRVSRPHRAGAISARALPPQPFPYLEWSDSRINFKLDQTKTRVYLDQVQGSLAHDSQGWRLQASFEPERTDLNLSNTGTVNVDGRWPSGGGPFRQRPFEMEFRLSNSYLAGSSALVAGHDAGVHGIVDAEVHVEGPGLESGGAPAGFHLTGRFTAHSLRRWDLLPPPATVQGNFAGLYFPASDRFELIGLGDPGWQHLQVEGEITNLFTRPALRLHLDLRQFNAANLLPLFMAVKANLPPDLSAQGMANGTAQLNLTGVARASEGLGGRASIALSGFALGSAADQLQIPTAEVRWSSLTPHAALRLLPTAATLHTETGVTTVQVAASAGSHGYEFDLGSRTFSAADAAALTRLLGLPTPWPRGLTGAAQLQLALGGDWSSGSPVGWTGSAQLAHPGFAPLAASGLHLKRVEVRYADPKPVRIQFTAALGATSGSASTPRSQHRNASRSARPSADSAVPGTITGTLWLPAAAGSTTGGGATPLGFDMRAGQISDQQIWTLLQPPQASLLQRLFGQMVLTPAWLTGLQARGTVEFSDLDWQGFHVGVRMDLRNGPQGWSASDLQLRLAGGSFIGSGVLNAGRYRLQGVTPPSHRLQVATLLAGTPYQGLVTGALGGSLKLQRPLGGQGLRHVLASGHFDLRGGRLAVAKGTEAFQLFAGDFHLDHDAVSLTNVVWMAAGKRWEGRGRADLAPKGTGFRLKLSRETPSPGGAVLSLSGPIMAPAPTSSQRRRTR